MAREMFEQYIKENGLNIEILETPQSTRTAIEAAQVHNVPVSNIVKSLLVKVDTKFILFLVPGDRKLDLERIKERFKAVDVRMANADEVKEITGYSIGGVPPFGHKTKLQTYIEDGFDTRNDIVAAAGSMNCCFKTTLQNIQNICYPV